MDEGRLARISAPAVLLIDAQPGFVTQVGDPGQVSEAGFDPVWVRIGKLVVLAAGLELPLIATLENPQRNGALPEAAKRAWPAHGRRIEKRTFDCCAEPAVRAALEDCGRAQLLVAGGETDVCVLQSVMSLLAGGFQVFLLEDCLFTTEPHPGPALRRMERAGAVPCTLKTAWYELMGSVDVYDDPSAAGPAWERLVAAFGDPELLPPWSPAL